MNYQNVSIMCIIMLISAILVCGCTGTSPKAPETPSQQQAPTTSIPTTLPPSYTTSPTDVHTTIPTTVPTEAPPPKYSAGEIVTNDDGNEIQIITELNEDIGKYRVRSAFQKDDEIYLSGGLTRERMGNWCSIKELDSLKLKSIGFADKIPIGDAESDLEGYMRYQDEKSMKFEEASPDNIEGDVKFILKIYYSGDVCVFSSTGRSTSTRTYSVSQFKEIELGVTDHAFVTVSRADYKGKSSLRAVLTAAGVVVAEGDVSSSPYSSVSLSYSTN